MMTMLRMKKAKQSKAIVIRGRDLAAQTDSYKEEKVSPIVKSKINRLFNMEQTFANL